MPRTFWAYDVRVALLLQYNSSSTLTSHLTPHLTPCPDFPTKYHNHTLSQLVNPAMSSLSTLLAIPTHLVLPLGLLLLSLHAARLSYGAATRLRDYEELARKAADWSAPAEERLIATRATHGSGGAAIVGSVVGAAYLLLRTRLLATPAGRGSATADQSATPLMVGVLCLVATGAAGAYMRSFWADKSKVPFVNKVSA